MNPIDTSYETVEIGLCAEVAAEPITDEMYRRLHSGDNDLSSDACTVLAAALDNGPDRYLATVRKIADEIEAWTETLDAYRGVHPFAVVEAD